MNVNIKRLLYVQDFLATEETKFLEVFWLGTLHGENNAKLNEDPELRGQVDEFRWFTKDELQDLKVFPKRLKSTFWMNLSSYEDSEDPFLGY